MSVESRDLKGEEARSAKDANDIGGGVRVQTQSAELDDDDRELEALGYVPSFKREFSNLATVRALTQMSLTNS